MKSKWKKVFHIVVMNHCQTMSYMPKSSSINSVFLRLSVWAGPRTMDSCWLLEVDGLLLRGGSSASGLASVQRDLTVRLGWAQFWTGVAAARAVPSRSEMHATRGTSVTHTRACTATSHQTSHDTRLECVHVSILQLEIDHSKRAPTIYFTVAPKICQLLIS